MQKRRTIDWSFPLFLGACVSGAFWFWLGAPGPLLSVAAFVFWAMYVIDQSDRRTMVDD